MVLISIFLILNIIFTVGATHDYFAWNRARWNAINDLTENGFSFKEIDGGFEFNGWYGFDSDYEAKNGQSWWWIYEDTYLIAFNNYKFYRVIEEYPYQRWIPWKQDKIYVLKYGG